MSSRTGAPQAGLDPRPHRARCAALAAVLLVATFAAYAPVLQADFVVYDDPTYVTANELVRNGLRPEGVAEAFTTFRGSNWIPLVWISLMADHELYGLDPAGYHLTNLVLHALSTLVLLLALVRLTGALGRSAFVAGLFALHPLHVESVAWISERKDVLSGLFWMATLVGYAHYVRRPSAGRYAGMFVPFGLGLLSKATLVTLPFVLLLLDLWPAGRYRESGDRAALLRRIARLGLEKLPLLALSIAASFLTYLAQQEAGSVQSQAIPLSVRVANAALAYVGYLEHAVWPVGLIFHYPYANASLTSASFVLSALLLVALTAWSVWLARNRGRAAMLVGWLWYLGTLVPMIGLVQVGMQGMADRYTYIPLIGVGIAVAWGASELLRGPRMRTLLALAAVLGLMAFGGATFAQARLWQGSEPLFRHALEHEPDSYMAHFALARFLQREGRYAEAERHARAATELAPHHPAAYQTLGTVLAAQERHEEAVQAYYHLLSRSPGSVSDRIRLGRSLLALGRPAAARGVLREALAADPRALEARQLLGDAHRELGDRTAALEAYYAVYTEAPEGAEGRAAGEALARLVADWDEASARWVERAVRTAAALSRTEPSGLRPLLRRLRGRGEASDAARSSEPGATRAAHGGAGAGPSAPSADGR